MAWTADFGDTHTVSTMLREFMQRTLDTASLDALLMVLRHHGHGDADARSMRRAVCDALSMVLARC